MQPVPPLGLSGALARDRRYPEAKERALNSAPARLKSEDSFGTVGGSSTRGSVGRTLNPYNRYRGLLLTLLACLPKAEAQRFINISSGKHIINCSHFDPKLADHLFLESRNCWTVAEGLQHCRQSEIDCRRAQSSLQNVFLSNGRNGRFTMAEIKDSIHALDGLKAQTYSKDPSLLGKRFGSNFWHPQPKFSDDYRCIMDDCVKASAQVLNRIVNEHILNNSGNVTIGGKEYDSTMLLELVEYWDQFRSAYNQEVTATVEPGDGATTTVINEDPVATSTTGNQTDPVTSNSTETNEAQASKVHFSTTLIYMIRTLLTPNIRFLFQFSKLLPGGDKDIDKLLSSFFALSETSVIDVNEQSRHVFSCLRGCEEIFEKLRSQELFKEYIEGPEKLLNVDNALAIVGFALRMAKINNQTDYFSGTDPNSTQMENYTFGLKVLIIALSMLLGCRKPGKELKSCLEGLKVAVMGRLKKPLEPPSPVKGLADAVIGKNKRETKRLKATLESVSRITHGFHAADNENGKVLIRPIIVNRDSIDVEALKIRARQLRSLDFILNSLLFTSFKFIAPFVLHESEPDWKKALVVAGLAELGPQLFRWLIEVKNIPWMASILTEVLRKALRQPELRPRTSAEEDDLALGSELFNTDRFSKPPHAFSWVGEACLSAIGTVRRPPVRSVEVDSSAMSGEVGSPDGVPLQQAAQQPALDAVSASDEARMGDDLSSARSDGDTVQDRGGDHRSEQSDDDPVEQSGDDPSSERSDVPPVEEMGGGRRSEGASSSTATSLAI